MRFTDETPEPWRDDFEAGFPSGREVENEAGSPLVARDPAPTKEIVMSKFIKPGNAAGGGLSLADIHGQTVLIRPTEIKTFETKHYGEKTAVVATVVVRDADGYIYHEDVALFPTVVKQQLSGCIGQWVIAKVGQGQASNGRKPPWVLDDTDSDDEQWGSSVLSLIDGDDDETPDNPWREE